METKTRIVGIIIKSKKLLMLKGKGFEELWTPGGKIEGKETDQECLERELDTTSKLVA
ncbi:MAG: NUDIX domain-containing protein [Candidatus Uhrbacteria bacterium]